MGDTTKQDQPVGGHFTKILQSVLRNTSEIGMHEPFRPSCLGTWTACACSLQAAVEEILISSPACMIPSA